MKRITSLIVLSLTLAAAHAQIRQGNIMVGADIADLALSLNKGGNFAIRIDPKLAVFIRNNIAVGGYLNFGLLTSKGGGTSIDYGLGLLGRYYFIAQNNNPVRNSCFFAEGSAGIEGTNPASGENTNGLGLGIGPGWTYFVTDNIGLEALVKFNSIVGFGHRPASSSLNLNLGFQIYLGSSRAKKE